ncbi:MAG: hypothetical protein KAY32_10335 [Candidatus Eisenbacteria sp.]|nr:hypothetical protein [Candidatus Eisenbacteria bacterium]
MHRSRAASMLFAMGFLGLLGLAPLGCSSEDGAPVAPGSAIPASGFHDSPPAMPTGLDMQKATDAGFALTWSPNRDDDLAGYRVYVYDPSPYRANSYGCPHGVELIDPVKTRYVYREDTSYGLHYFMLAAVDFDGNESIRCGPLEFAYSGAPHSDARNDARGPSNEFGPTPGEPAVPGPNGRDDCDQEN